MAEPPLILPTLATASGLQPLLDAPVEVRLMGSHMSLTLDALLQLDPETPLPLGAAAETEVALLVNERMVARGRLALVDGRIGITITQIIQDGLAGTSHGA